MQWIKSMTCTVIDQHMNRYNDLDAMDKINDLTVMDQLMNRYKVDLGRQYTYVTDILELNTNDTMTQTSIKCMTYCHNDYEYFG